MLDRAGPEQKPKFRILHILRSPVGGLFRHVVDLAKGQAERGHQVGIVADSTTGSARSAAMLAELAPLLELGIHRLPMHRGPHPGDLRVQLRINGLVAELQPDVVHGHGSKGGLYARLPAAFSIGRGIVRAYTPHGGSLHFTPGVGGHAAYTFVEQVLERGTDLFLFECAFAADRYRSMIRPTRRMVRIVHNGLHLPEFETVEPAADATDLLFIGELRMLKGIDTLVEALRAIASDTGAAPSLSIVGAGPDERTLRDVVRDAGLSDRVRFAGAMPAREAFRIGRIVVVPSRMESFPYIVLEAVAAGRPVVATKVGGIPEIFGNDAARLVVPDNPIALAAAIRRMQADVAAGNLRLIERLQRHVRQSFTVDAMVGAVLDGYADAMLEHHAPAMVAAMRTGREILGRGQ